MRQLVFVALSLFALMLGGGATWGVLHAADVSGALYTIIARWTNTGAATQNDIRASFPISGAALIDENMLATDALNAALQKGSVDQAGMPPTNRIIIEGLVLKSGGSFTEYTTEAQSDTLNDVPLLPADPVVDDAIYWGCDNPCRIVTWDVDTAGVNTLTLALEYWDGARFTALGGVNDDTDTFTTEGRNTMSWNMPTDWATRTVTGSSVNSYWARARLSAVTSQTTQPLGSQVHYENGEWWTWVESIATDNQEQYTLYLGGDDMVAAHQIFPGSAGIITADDSTIEPGGSYSLGYQGRLNFSTTGESVCLACKTGAFTLHATGSASAAGLFATLTGSGTTKLELAGLTLPDSGSQTVIMGASGSTVALFADAGGGLALGTSQTITDNANSWTWASEGSTDYLESVRLYTAAPSVFNIDDSYTQWAQGTHTDTQAYTGALGLDNQ